LVENSLANRSKPLTTDGTLSSENFVSMCVHISLLIAVHNTH